MVETVIKHLTEFKQLTDAAIPFRLLNEKGEKNCARAAEKIIKNQVADEIPFLRKETLLYLMENPEAIDWYAAPHLPFFPFTTIIGMSLLQTKFIIFSLDISIIFPYPYNAPSAVDKSVFFIMFLCDSTNASSSVIWNSVSVSGVTVPYKTFPRASPQ